MSQRSGGLRRREFVEGGTTNPPVETARDDDVLARTGDPGASDQEIRDAMDRLVKPRRGRGGDGIPPAPEIACLAGAVLRLLERVERLGGADKCPSAAE